MRKRKQIIIRIDEEEYKVIKSLCSEYGYTIQRFITDSLHEKNILPKEELKELIIELKHQGNNLNQIARELNSRQNKFDYVHIITWIKEYQKVWQQLRSYLLEHH